MPTPSRVLPLAITGVQIAMLAWLVVWSNQEAPREGTTAAVVAWAKPAVAFAAAAAAGFAAYYFGNWERLRVVRVVGWTVEGLTLFAAAVLSVMVPLEILFGGMG